MLNPIGPGILLQDPCRQGHAAGSIYYRFCLFGRITLATSEKTSNSILGQVAQHEQQLLAQIVASEAEAQRIIDEARAEARKHLQSSEVELNEEIAKLRREAEESRLQAFQATVDAAEKRLDSLRAETSRRVPELADKALGLFLPGGSA